MNDNLNPILLRIDQLCQQYNWSHYKIAKAADIPLASLNSMFQRNTSPTLPTLEKICAGFQISLKEFFNYEFESDTEQNRLLVDSEARQLLERYHTLSKSDKRLLFAYLDGLQRIDYSQTSDSNVEKEPVSLL